VKGNGRGIFQSTLPAFACCWFSVTIDRVQTKIRTEYLPNTSSERYRFTNLLGDPHFVTVTN
jgi:hypothetical protein